MCLSEKARTTWEKGDFTRIVKLCVKVSISDYVESLLAIETSDLCFLFIVASFNNPLNNSALFTRPVNPFYAAGREDFHPAELQISLDVNQVLYSLQTAMRKSPVPQKHSPRY